MEREALKRSVSSFENFVRHQKRTSDPYTAAAT